MFVSKFHTRPSVMYKIVPPLVIALLLSMTTLAQEKVAPDTLFFQKAEAYRERKDYKNAIEQYDNCLTINKKNPKVLYWKGVCHLAIKEDEKGVALLKKCLTVDSTYLAAYYRLLEKYNSTENNNEAILMLDHIIKLEKDKNKKISACRKIVKKLLNEELYSNVLPYIETTLVIAPNQLDMLYIKAKINNSIGRYQIAISTAFPVLSNLNTKDIKNISRFNYEIGHAYHYLEQYDTAKSYLKNVKYKSYRQLVNKLKPEYFYKVALSFLAIYEYEIAESMLLNVLKIEPSFYNAYNLLADIEVKKMYPQQAVTYYKEAMEKLSHEQEEWINKIYNDKLIPILINAEKYDEAVDFCDKASEKFPNAINFTYLKAITLYHQGKGEEAIPIMEKLIAELTDISPEKYLYNFTIGIMYDKQNNTKKAKEVFKISRQANSFFNASTYAYEQVLKKENKAAVMEEATERKE